MRGRYVREQQWLLDNRIYRGQPGYHVFTPFVIEGDERPACWSIVAGWQWARRVSFCLHSRCPNSR